MLKINGRKIVREEQEFGIGYEDGEWIMCENAEDAVSLVRFANEFADPPAHVVTRYHYITEIIDLGVPK